MMGRYGCYCKEYTDKVKIGFEAGEIYMELSNFLQEFSTRKGYHNVAEAINLYIADWVAGMVKEDETRNLDAFVARLELALQPAGIKLIKEIEKIKNGDKVECDGLFRFWFLDEKNYEKVKYCPNCGSKDIIMPNDLIEWQCKKCGCWWGL